jgi:PPOX class probable F420-dependent enzyme
MADSGAPTVTAKEFKIEGNMEIADAQKFLQENHRACIAVRQRDGWPQMTFVTPGIDPEGRVIITSRGTTYKIKHLRRDPRVSMLIFGEQYSGSKFVQIHGTAEIIEQPEAMDTLEGLLGERRYLAGNRISEADWRVFPTLLRFDLVDYSHFKCNVRRIQDYPNLANYLRELYQWPGIKDTLDLQKIKAGYYSQRNVNPTGIVPLGPTLDHLDQPHDRERLQAAA